MTAQPDDDESRIPNNICEESADAEGDLYAILGAQPSASDEELKALYRRLVLQCHPDKVSEDKERALVAFQRVDRAWKTLSDPLLRSQYDTRQRADQLTTTLVNDEIDQDDMSWDEDEQTYYHTCRCGGEYALPAAAAAAAENHRHSHGSRLLNCSNCSLCILVTIGEGHSMDSEGCVQGVL